MATNTIKVGDTWVQVSTGNETLEAQALNGLVIVHDSESQPAADDRTGIIPPAGEVIGIAPPRALWFRAYDPETEVTVTILG